MGNVMEKDCSERMDCLRKEVQDRIDLKLSQKVFWGVLGILVTISGSMFFLMMGGLKDVETAVNKTWANISETKSDVSYIKGRMEANNFKGGQND